MSQNITVVQCYSCSTFQTKIVTISKKWCCVVCNEKQSLKETFGTGSGKDCRLRVQQLNQMRLSNANRSTLNSSELDSGEIREAEASSSYQFAHSSSDVGKIQNFNDLPEVTECECSNYLRYYMCEHLGQQAHNETSDISHPTDRPCEEVDIASKCFVKKSKWLKYLDENDVE